MKCCVIIPVGPGHKQLSQRAISSVQQAIESGMGAFTEVEVIAQDDSLGQGRSRARNLGVAAAGEKDAEWLFFLDADDLMAPNAFIDVQPYLNDYDAVWGAIHVADLATQQITRRENEVNPITSLEQVLINPPFLTLQNGHFVRQQVAAQQPYNTEMDCGEDFEYYLRVWRDHACIKIEQPLFFNVRGQHSTGPRSATGADWSKAIPEVFSSFCRDNEIIANVPFGDRLVKFRLSNTLDLIQNQLARERFFEAKELSETMLVLPRNAVVFDVGSNIGNHALFLTCIGDAKEIHCFEPADITADLLEENFRINDIATDRYSITRIGVGAANGTASFDRLEASNLGATSIKNDASGTIQVDSLDNRHPETLVDLLKIDVEGMELEVLSGAQALIKRSRPIVLIEISNANKGAFLAWVAKNDYRIHRAFELVHASNYLLVPSSLRKDFYRAGVAATSNWTPRVPLGPSQAPCGWSIKDFLGGYLENRRAVELIRGEDNTYLAFDLQRQTREHLSTGPVEIGRKFPGSIVLLGEILGELSDGQLQQTLDSLAKNTAEIILFDIMDARWDKAFNLNSQYRDAEYYLLQANKRGYQLKHYQKLPHKAALGVHEQLDSRITLLHLKKG